MMTERPTDDYQKKIRVFENNQGDVVIDSSQNPDKKAREITRDDYIKLIEQGRPKPF
jgi:hypothetical protein